MTIEEIKKEVDSYIYLDVLRELRNKEDSDGDELIRIKANKLAQYIHNKVEEGKREVAEELKEKICNDYCDVLDTGGSCDDCISGTLEEIINNE